MERRKNTACSFVMLLVFSMVARADNQSVPKPPITCGVPPQTQSTIHYLDAGHNPHTAWIAKTDIHEFVFPHADDPNWVDQADGTRSAESEWLTYIADSGGLWHAKIHCKVGGKMYCPVNSGDQSVTCYFEHKPEGGGKGHDDVYIQYMGPDGKKYRARMADVPQRSLPAAPQFFVGELGHTAF